MGKINLFTVLTATVVQFLVGTLWYGSYLFGDVVTAGGGHAIDFLKLDGVSLLLILLSGYGLTTVVETLVDLTGTKDIGGGVKLGLTFGGLGIGFPVIAILNLMGFGKVLLLVIFCHIVLITILTSLVVLKLKKT